MPMPGVIKSGEDVMLHFQVRDAAGKPVSDLQPYLGAMGHAVLLSADSNIYLHTHPTDGAHAEDAQAEGAQAEGDHAKMEHAAPAAGAKGGPDVMFHTNFPVPGLYKVWGQFQHKGRIVTAPFVLNVAQGAKKVAGASAGGAKLAAYYCPAHPQVTSNDPKAKCAKCGGMKLVKRPSA
jgi:hypothetical protein